MSLTPFTYGDRPVRVVTIDGEPWFVLADLCRVLDLSNHLSNPTMVADRLDADALSTAEVIASPAATRGRVSASGAVPTHKRLRPEWRTR